MDYFNASKQYLLPIWKEYENSLHFSRLSNKLTHLTVEQDPSV